MERHDPARQEIEQHLATILSSPEFRGSERSKEFLRFIVTRLLDGETDTLHERAIAVDLLGRDPGYDPADDAIVRVKANEVRKRLARYYEATGKRDAVRIELPVGGYVPRLRQVESKPMQTAPPTRPRGGRVRLVAWVVIATLTLAGALLLLFRNGHDSLQDFWQPVHHQRNPVLICVPGLRGLVPESGTELSRQYGALPMSQLVAGDVAFRARDGDRLYIQNDYVGMGASFGAIGIANHLAQAGKAALPRVAQDVSFADLRSHPAVLLGAFSSRWTLQMSQRVPFTFVNAGGTSRIVEVREPKRSWTAVGREHSGHAEEDYAILARILDSQSGQVIFIAAGITTYGTQCAAECSVDASCIAKVVAGAPRDWPSKSVQAVLHTRVLGNTPGPADVVAVKVW